MPVMVSRRVAALVLAAVALVAAGAGVYTARLLRGGGYGEVSVGEAYGLMEEGGVLPLDVRTPEEFAGGHLEGAVNIPVDKLEARLDELPRDQPLLVYSRTGNRSSRALDILRDAGFTQVYHMSQGITAWIQEGYPTTTG